MAAAIDPMRILAGILAEHGPLDEDDIARRLQNSGVADPDYVLDELLDETNCPARELVDDGWVWLPTVLAGRVFTHRLGADEVAHDLLTVTPDLDPITALCEHEQYQQLADGSRAQVVLPGFDDALLEQRGTPDEVVNPLGALLLLPGTLGALGVAEGDLVGVRLTVEGLAVERVTALAHAEVGAELAALLDADEPVHFDAAVWTACVTDPAAFAEPLRPLSEIADAYGLEHRGEWLAPGGFDFDRWHFDHGCASLARRHDLDPNDAFAVYTLVKFYDQMSLLIDAEADEPLSDARTPADGASGHHDADVDESFVDLVGELGAELADPLLAEVLVAETVGTGRAGASALGLFAEVLEPKVPRAARVGGVSMAARRGAGTDRRHRDGRTRAAGSRVDGYGLAAGAVRSGAHRLRSRRRRARIVAAAPRRRRAGPPAGGAAAAA